MMKPQNIDEALRAFAEYSVGIGSFDELDFKEFIVDVYVPGLTFAAAKPKRGGRIKNGWLPNGMMQPTVTKPPQSSSNKELKEILWSMGIWDDLTHDQHIELAARITAYTEKKVLEVIGEDEFYELPFPSEGEYADEQLRTRNQLRAEQRKSLKTGGSNE